MRCIYESLAMKYRTAVNELEDCTNKKFSKLYMVGGGTKDKFLSELTADSLGIEVSRDVYKRQLSYRIFRE